MSDKLSLDGVISIVRGRRTDVADNLYRLSPYSARVGLTYDSDAWSFRSEVIGSHDQDKVSSYNSEEQTAGYWLANLAGSWSPGAALRVEARIDNVFDESYQDHVAGINRVQGSGVPAGARLSGAQRTVSVGLVYTF